MDQGQQEQPGRLFRRYTPQARRVVTRAHEEARRLQHSYLGGEHLLLALLHDERGNGARMLVSLGLDFDEVETTLAFMLAPGDIPPTDPLLPTPRLSQAFDLAQEEAAQRSLQTIGTEDLLLGLLREGTNVAAKVLTTFAITEQAIRERIAHLSPDREREPNTGIKGNVLTCRIDDHTLAIIDALVEAGIRPTRSAAAAWLIQAGITANQSLVDKVHTTLTEIRRLRDEVHEMASR